MTDAGAAGGAGAGQGAGAGGRAVGATYRLQLGGEVTFAAAAGLVDYLAALGVTHLYLSPVLQARAGSTHGYDVADPGRVCDELGGRAGLEALARAAHARGLGLVADIVPNHLGTGPDNPLWDELLASGRTGPEGSTFDVDWDPPLPGSAGKVILPVLGAPYGQVLHSGELGLAEEGGRPRVRYHEHSFPLSEPSAEAVGRSGGASALAGVGGRPETWARLHGLLEQQHYRLVHWRAGDALVNYRRFFAIADLAAVRVEDPAVYERTHALVTELVRDGVLDGLRVDHVDGLADPGGYLRRLRAGAGGAWIAVEKILGPGERLPDWPVEGTTGYDFLADALRLQVDPASEAALTELAREFGAWQDDPAGAARGAKDDALAADLAADLDRLTARLWSLCQGDLVARDVTRRACERALRETVVRLDTYRTYTRPGEPDDAGGGRTRRALAGARGAVAPGGPQGVPGVLWEFLEAVLTGRAGDGEEHAEVLRRFQQLTGAAMAKGVEDTYLYRQARLSALNEVGVDPGHLAGDHLAAFHASAAERAARHPAGMVATATHDTKRGEDVRLRIAALSELVGPWRDAVTRWAGRHRQAVAATPDGPAPDPATEYLLYQTLAGVWPLRRGRERLGELRERVGAYLVKAAREAGLRTSWTDPDEAFESGVTGFVAWLLDPGRSGAFLDELEALCDRVAEIAMTTGLGQVLLRCTAPGVADTYQGCELWEDSLVDPDNRRPVDFRARALLLAELDRDAPPPAELLAARRDGRVKLWVLTRALRARREHAACLGPGGGYRPLAASGAFARHVVAFARTAPGAPGQAAVAIVPRLPGAVMAGRDRPPLGPDWGDTAVPLEGPLAGPVSWRDALGGPGASGGTRLELAAVLAELPVALLVRQA